MLKVTIFVCIIFANHQVWALKTSTTHDLANNLLQALINDVSYTSSVLTNATTEFSDLIYHRTDQYLNNTNNMKNPILRKLLSDLQVLQVQAVAKNSDAVKCLANAEAELTQIVAINGDEGCVNGFLRSAFNMLPHLERENSVALGNVKSYEQRLDICGEIQDCIQQFINFIIPQSYQWNKYLLTSLATVHDHIMQILIYKIPSNCNALDVIQQKGGELLTDIENCINAA